MKKMILRIICIIILLPILFVIVNAVSVMLPNKIIHNNVIESIPVIKEEGIYYNQLKPYYGYFKGYQYDNHTDSLILTVAYDSKDGLVNPFKRSISNYICNSVDPITCLENVALDSSFNSYEYTRYWFGTSYILRLLLIIFNLVEIRYINMIALFSLLVIFIILLYKKTNLFQSLIFIYAFLNIGLFILPFSLQLLPCFLISLISSIIILLYSSNKKFNDEYIFYLFLLIGMLTSYFDLLTYPLITFGIPMIVYLLVNKPKKDDYKALLKYMIFGLLWLIGYIIPFLFKFIYSSIVLNKNVIKSSFDEIFVRTSLGEQNINRLNGIKNNIFYIFNGINIRLIEMYYVYFLFNILKNKKFKVNYINLIVLTCLGLLPMAWYMILLNHSVIHSFMTYRITIILFICLLDIPLLVFSKKTQK